MADTLQTVKEQMDVIIRGASEIIPEEDLLRKLERSVARGTPLRIKLGCDPSRPDLHLGHSVVLRKLRQFQDLGHEAVLIIGDFTGMIGDPSGRNTTRPPLTLEQTRENGRTYIEQASKILASDRMTTMYNSDWLGIMRFEDVISLASKITVAQMLERDDFEKRLKSRKPISLHELLYPLAQGMDSVAIRADVELGGTDQKFNLLVGRELQRQYGQEAQVILTMPLVEGTDGVEKMSKAYDNYIAFNDTPDEFYGKVLSIPDDLILPWFTLLTDVHPARIEQLKKEIASGSNPRDAKRELARDLISLYHGPEDAIAAEERFDRIFSAKLPPEEIDVYFRDQAARLSVLDVIVAAGLVSSRNEGRSMFKQAAVSVNGEKATDPAALLPDLPECIIKVGKRRFIRVISKDSTN